MKRAAFGLALLLLCGGVTSPSSSSPTLLGQPVAGSPIRHVIVLVQENRTFDNLFASSTLAHGGPYPGADTAQTTTVDGERVALKPVPLENPGDPSHTHLALLGEWNGGKMDGFANDRVFSILPWTPPPRFPLAYVPASQTSIYHLLAARYALADENFAPRLVPTFPSHYTLFTAQSRVAGNPKSAIWGCDAKPGTTVPVFFGRGEEMLPAGVFPCFDQPTIADLLDQGHVSWRYYTGRYNDVVNQTVNIYDAFRKIRYGPGWQRNVVTPSGRILADIASCKLPQVSFVMPNALDSDHAGTLSAGGPGWVGSIYLALVQSRNASPQCDYYKDSAVILTWDDSGGWYDHVAPPAGPDGTTWGFRIPIVVVSAWARSNYDPAHPSATPFVSHRRRESTAIAKFIETNWGLGNLGQRDLTDDDLSDMFDYTRAAPVPAVSALAMRRLIRRTHFNLAVAERDAGIVDDDR